MATSPSKRKQKLNEEGRIFQEEFTIADHEQLVFCHESFKIFWAAHVVCQMFVIFD